MASNHDKYVIECWLRLYNRLMGASFAVVDWPDTDSSQKNIDAICRDDSDSLLAIEHTLIQPFEREKADADRFIRTLGSLENHADLLQKGYTISASQSVHAIPTGVDWKQIGNGFLAELKRVLPTLPEGSSSVTIKGANWTVDLEIDKTQTGQNTPGKFLTMRAWPGDPGPELIVRALKEKVPKLSAHARAKKILLFEQDAIAGTTENQFEQLPHDPYITELLRLLDEVWSAKTAGLESAHVIFTSQIWPAVGTNRCSLDLLTGRFWRGPC